MEFLGIHLPMKRVVNGTITWDYATIRLAFSK